MRGGAPRRSRWRLFPPRGRLNSYPRGRSRSCRCRCLTAYKCALRWPNGAEMRAGVRGPCRSGPCRSVPHNGRHGRRRVGAGLDHSTRGSGRQPTQRRDAGAVCTPESSDPATATAARRRRHAGRDMNAAATPCRVNPGGMAGPACRKRCVWGAERQCGDDWNTGQDPDRPADAAHARRGFAAV